MNLVKLYKPVKEKIQREKHEKFLEDYILNQTSNLFIEVAYGEQLDMYADTVGIERFPGEDDVDLRERIKLIVLS